MTSLQMYQVDAFTDRVFGGNPAAVCPLDQWLPDDVMRSALRARGSSARSRGSRRSYATSWRVLCAWMLSGTALVLRAAAAGRAW